MEKGQHRRQEGARSHILAFAFSIVLTMIAFATVAYGDLDRWFVLSFTVPLALVQVVVQLAFWMHMKDKGHTYALIFIAFGAFVFAAMIVTAVYWIWW